MTRGEQVYSTTGLARRKPAGSAEVEGRSQGARSQCCQLRQVYHIALVKDTGVLRSLRYHWPNAQNLPSDGEHGVPETGPRHI
jgi:hypothetical protein